MHQNHTTCMNPATGDTIGESPLNTTDDLSRAIHQARIAQKAWASTPIKIRVKALFKVREYIASHADELADIIHQDNGKTRLDAMVTDVLPAAMAINYYAKNAKSFLKDRWIKPGNILLFNKISKVARVPFGVIGIISPWNYPFSIPISELTMGILAGNAVVLKTATETQMIGRAIERCITAADLPEHIFSFINLPGKIAGDAMLENGVDKLFFTGSTAAGKYLMEKAARTLTPVSLELGGNDAMLVCPDADLTRTVNGAIWAGMQNSGQSCGGVERIYAHKDIYSDFVALLSDKVRVLRVGYDTDFNFDIGSMTTKRQTQIVYEHIQDALSKGAEIAAQSELPETSGGNFLPATLLINVNHSMKIMREETFGPVFGVMPVDTMEHAVDLANDSKFGLTGSVWSKDRRKAEDYGRRIQAGVITINDHLMSHGMAETPWGGFKQSGIGRTHGAIGFDEMTEPQCIVHDILPRVKKNMWWYPHHKSVYNGMKGAVELLYSPNLLKRIYGGGRTLRTFLRTFWK